MGMTQRELFDRITKLETDKLTIAADIKQIKDDAKYCEDMNPQGISKEDIKLIAAASKLQAKNDFEERKEASNAVFAKYEELTGYDQ